MQINYSRRVGVSYLWTAAECRLPYLNVEASEILADEAYKRLMRTADMLLPWALATATQLKIPELIW